jgi:hypothetical protein
MLLQGRELDDGRSDVLSSPTMPFAVSALPPWPVLDRLRQVDRLDLLSAGQVGNRPRQLHASRAMIRPGAHLQLLHRRSQQAPARIVYTAAFLALRPAPCRRWSADWCLQSGVAACPAPLPLALDGRRRLPQPIVRQSLVLNAGHLDVVERVDPVQQWAGDPLLVRVTMAGEQVHSLTGSLW